MSENSNSVQQILPSANLRDISKVPFVEMIDGRLQGVVSSGSDISRVYVSFFKRGTHNYGCSTNNNRPCGGLRGAPCKHLTSLLENAIEQYGIKRVVDFLEIDVDLTKEMSLYDIINIMNGTVEKDEVSLIFSRFLNHLSYMEYPIQNTPMIDMNWFITSNKEI